MTLGFILFVFIGITLGLIGGGGSVLGVPVLVYIMKYPAEIATGYSLFIVGSTSLVGSFSHLRKGNFSLEALLLFAIPSIFAIFLMRKIIMPAVPPVLFETGGYPVTKNMLIMLVFSVLLLASSVSMIKKNNSSRQEELFRKEFSRSPLHVPVVIILGILVGMLSGLVGAGGGFMIIPALVIVLGISMKQAIGTSLAIISVNSLIGFSGNIGQFEIDWKFLLTVSGLALVGIFIGSRLTDYVSGKKLKPAFGWFTLCVGTFVFIKEVFIN